MHPTLIPVLEIEIINAIGTVKLIKLTILRGNYYIDAVYVDNMTFFPVHDANLPSKPSQPGHLHEKKRNQPTNLPTIYFFFFFLKHRSYSQSPTFGALPLRGVLTPELGRLFLFRSNPSIFASFGHSSSSARAINLIN